MSPRSRNATLLALSFAAITAGAVAAIAQSRSPSLPPPGLPVPLTPPDGVPLGPQIPLNTSEPLPAAELPPLPFLVPPPNDSVLSPSPPPTLAGAAAPAPSDPAAIRPVAPPAAAAPNAQPTDTVQSAASAGPRPVTPAAAALPPAASSPTVGGMPPTALVGDPELGRQIERWQKDLLLYSFALRAMKEKEQLCELSQAPAEICGPRRGAVPEHEGEPRPVFAPPPRFVEPAPLPDRGPPYRVLSVAGSGGDIVVTLLNTDLQATHTVRSGAWIDSDFKVVSVDFQNVTIRGRGRTHRLPVSSGATWGTRS